MLPLHCHGYGVKRMCDWFQSTAWFPATEQDTLLAVARWTAALTPVLKLRCRWQTDVRKELQVKPLDQRDNLCCAVLCWYTDVQLGLLCCAVSSCDPKPYNFATFIALKA